ncbi:MAG: hypothetical protein HOY79_19495 [Streptomyces sp.]|nr:hypothetical protein [Streptomyces sp.]
MLRPARTGQTWGMRLVGIRVVKADRSPLTVNAAFLRALLSLIDGMACGLAVIVMARSLRRQRPADVVAGTLVVRDRRVPGRSRATNTGMDPAEAAQGGDRLILGSPRR